MPLAASAWASSARAGALAAAAARLPAAGTARRRPMGAAFSHLLRAASSAPPPEDGLWLVVGLGNPGPRYAATRHNVGFAAVDALAAAAGAPLDRLQHGCAVGRARVGGAKALLAKPQLFMNNSGEGVGKLARFYGVPAERVLVIYDDLDSPLGSVRARAKGGAGGHNGVRSVAQHLQGADFPRVKVGIARPPPGVPVASYVLQPFAVEEREAVDAAVAGAADAARAALVLGVEKAVSGARVDADGRARPPPPHQGGKGVRRPAGKKGEAAAAAADAAAAAEAPEAAGAAAS